MCAAKLLLIFHLFIDSADLEVTVEFLVEVDKLVQMIESPIFACECFFFYKSHI